VRGVRHVRGVRKVRGVRGVRTSLIGPKADHRPPNRAKPNVSSSLSAWPM
jgi:hypothetical protein